MKMLAMVSGLTFATIATIAASALAARSGVGLTITDITIIGSDARIFLSGTIGGTQPTCSTHPNHFAIDVDSNKGKALLSLATAAMLAGKTVNVTGVTTDTCAVLSTFQTLDQLTMNQ